MKHFKYIYLDRYRKYKKKKELERYHRKRRKPRKQANGIPQRLARVITSTRKTRTSLEESQDGSILQNQNATNVAHLGIMQINAQT